MYRITLYLLVPENFPSIVAARRRAPPLAVAEKKAFHLGVEKLHSSLSLRKRLFFWEERCRNCRDESCCVAVFFVAVKQARPAPRARWLACSSIASVKRCRFGVEGCYAILPSCLLHGYNETNCCSAVDFAWPGFGSSVDRLAVVEFL